MSNGPGRKSVVSHERNEVTYLSTQKSIQERKLECFILDVCGAHNPKTKFFPGLEISQGIEFIVFCKNNYEVYRFLYNEDYDLLRTCYGQDSNLVGRDMIIFANSYSKSDVYEGKSRFGLSYNIKFQDEFEQSYISLSTFGSMEGDLDCQVEMSKTNPTSGKGKIWRPV